MGFVRFILDEIVDGIPYRAVVRDFVHPYWDIQENSELKNQPGLLLSKFLEIATNPKVYKAFTPVAQKLQLPPDAIDDVFLSASIEIPSEDLIDLAECIARSDTYLLISTYTPRAVTIALNICKRASLDKKSDILSAFDSTPILRKVLNSHPNYEAAQFFVETVKDKDDETAISILRRSPTWRSMLHDSNFIEWIRSMDGRLVKATI